MSAACATLAAATALAACGGGSAETGAAEEGAKGSARKLHTVRIAPGSFQSGGLNTALYDDLGRQLESASNPWHLPAGSDLELLSCEPGLNEPGNSGTCAFAVAGERKGFALAVTTNAGGTAANWVAAGEVARPGY
ncbi:MAG: hypothetical protein U0R71_14195 [Solirubrobacterales bacterium]